MASPAKRLQAIDIERVLPRFALQRRDVVALQATGPAALHTTVAVMLKDGAPDSRPAASIQEGVTLAQVPLFRISSLSGRQAGWFRLLVVDSRSAAWVLCPFCHSRFNRFIHKVNGGDDTQVERR